MLITGAGASSTPKDGMPDGGGAGAGLGAGLGVGAGAGIGTGLGAVAQANVPSRRITSNSPVINLFMRASSCLLPMSYYIITLIE